MKRIIDFLEKNNSGSLATINNGKPRVRPFGFRFYDNGRFYFSTANTKDVFKQLKQNPFIEFTSTSKDMVTVRLSGEVIFTNDISVKEIVIEKAPYLKASYKGAGDPNFEVFYIEHGEIIMSDFSKNPNIEIRF